MSKSGMDILDRHINYAEEILRLSLLGIATISFVLIIAYKGHTIDLTNVETISFFISFALLCLAAVLSIRHRHVATRYMTYLVTNVDIEDPAANELLVMERGGRMKKIKILLITDLISFTLGIVFFAITILLICILSNQAHGQHKSPNDNDKIEVDFVQVNDVYEIAPLDNGKIGGMARVASFKRACVAKNPNTMLVIAGDFLSPSVYSNMKQDTLLVAGRQMVDAMNAAGFDLAIFGNHEFDVNQNHLNLCINESNFEWVSSNTFSKGGNRKHFKKNGEDIPETLVKQFVDEDGTVAKIGFMGLTINSNHADYVEYDTTFENERKLYTELSKSCDAVVAITHQSVEQDEALARRLPGLAVIIGGHEHDMQFKKVGNVYITKAHANAKSVFYIKLKIDKKNKTLNVTPELKYLDTSIPPDALTDAIVNKWISFSNDYFKTSGFNISSVIYTGPALDGRDEQVRKDSANNLAKIIIQAMESVYPDATLAVMNAGSIRIDDVLTSPVTEYDILRALPFGGSTKKASIRGDTLVRMLDAGTKNIGTGGFIQYSSFVKKRTDGWYIKNSKINDLTSYKVAIAEYLRKGNSDGLGFLKNIRVLDSAMAGVTDIKSDIRLAVIKQMSKLTVRNK